MLRSRWSLGILGVREDQEAAQATGVHVLRHKLLALGLSALFMGFAGAVFAFKQISYYPEAPFSPTWTFEALMIAYIGGLGTVAGPVIGAIFFVVVRERLAANLTDVHQVIFGVLFILVVLVFSRRTDGDLGTSGRLGETQVEAPGVGKPRGDVAPTIESEKAKGPAGIRRGLFAIEA